jgi:hypothetical protein
MFASGAPMAAFAKNPDLIYEIAFFHSLYFGLQRYLIMQLFGHKEAADKACPACLVRSTKTFAGIAMKIFKKQDVFTKIRIFLKKRLVCIDRSVSIGISGEQGNDTLREFL